MTPSEIERLVARHLDGAMSIDEEEEFFIRVAVDGELRRTLKAQRIVESALRKKHAAAPLPPANARGQLQAMLAGGAPGTTPHSAPRPPLSRAPHPAPGALGGISTVGTAMLGALGALATVTFLSYSLSTKAPEPARDLSDSTPRSLQQQRMTKPAESRARDSVAADAPSAPSATAADMIETPQPRHSTTLRATPPAMTGASAPRRSHPARLPAGSLANGFQPGSDSTGQKLRQPVPQVSDQDTIRLKVRIEPPKP
jgi:hypothetical protein